MNFPTLLLAMIGVSLAFGASSQAATEQSCACRGQDHRVLGLGDLMRPRTAIPAPLNPEYAWRSYRSNVEFWAFDQYGKITELQTTDIGCMGTLSMDVYTRARRGLVAVPVSNSVGNLCELARVAAAPGTAEGKTPVVTPVEDTGSIGRLEQEGGLDAALPAGRAEDGSPVSPFPAIYGPFEPGMSVYALKDDHGATRGQYGIILGPSKKAGLLRVGFYCGRFSVMGALAGFGVGGFLAGGHRRCENDVPATILGATNDNPPEMGAP